MGISESVQSIHELLPGMLGLYNRLLLVVGLAGAGKTTVLRSVGARDQVRLINLGVELSRRLLDQTERQRIIQLPALLEEIASEEKAELLILDNTEILFNPALKQDPLRLLLGISRNRTVLASWLGQIVDGHLIYAEAGHPEFRRYSMDGLLAVSLGAGVAE
jgi:hypothetical protein